MLRRYLTRHKPGIRPWVHCYQQQRVAGCSDGHYAQSWQSSHLLFIPLGFLFILRDSCCCRFGAVVASSVRFFASAAEIRAEGAFSGHEACISLAPASSRQHSSRASSYSSANETRQIDFLTKTTALTKRG